LVRSLLGHKTRADVHGLFGYGIDPALNRSTGFGDEYRGGFALEAGADGSEKEIEKPSEKRTKAQTLT
jgi:hypothetical protein